MIRSIRAILIACTALLACAPALAQYKVGIVNLDRLIRDAPAAVAAQKRLQQEFAGREKELNTLAERLKQGQDNLTRNAPTMSESARQARERELFEINRDLQRKQQALQEDVAQRRNEALSALIDQANRAVRQIAQAEKYDAMFQEAAFWNPAIDITEKVMKLLVDPPGQK